MVITPIRKCKHRFIYSHILHMLNIIGWRRSVLKVHIDCLVTQYSTDKLMRVNMIHKHWLATNKYKIIMINYIHSKVH